MASDKRQLWTATLRSASSPTWYRMKVGALARVAVSGSTLAGTTSKHEIYVAKVGTYAWKRVTGKLWKLSLDGSRAVGIAGDKSVWCTDNIFSPRWTRMGNGKLVSVSLSSNTVCGVAPDGKVYTARFKDSRWRHREPGILQEISISGKRAYGVTGRGEIFHADDIFSPRWTKIKGKARTVAYAGNIVIVAASNGTVHAARARSSNPKWQQIA